MPENNTSFADKLSTVTDKINSIGFLSRTPEKKTVIIAFCVLLCLIGAVSGFLVIDETRGNKDETTGTLAEETSQTTVQSSAPAQEIKANFLMILGDGEDISLMSVVGLDSLEEKVRVAFIDPEGVCVLDGKTATFERHFKDGGVTKLIEAVSTFADISIEKYILGDEGDFTDLVKSMGEFPVAVDERIEAAHDGISFIIDKGEQTLIPDMMLKYFLYLCDNQPSSYIKLANLMMQFGERLFSTEDEAALESNINSFISKFETDISALDFTEYKSAVKKLAAKEVINGMIIEGEAYHLGETTIG